MSAREAPHIIEARSTQEQALKHRCPFCHSDPGQQCRAHRGRGHELDYPHSRRIALSRPAEDRRRVQQVNALCCVCGNLRTVSSDYHRYQDPNHAGSPEGKAKGWLKTQTLKCEACATRTRHALLKPSEDRWRDWDERRQLIALGDSDDSKYPWSDEYIAQLRREYRELFPRNPNLRHRFYIAEAQKVWDEGRRDVIALCGEPVTIETDPRTWDGGKADDNRVRNGGYLVADQLSDTEYEDPETGLWWIDMSCVDCCRVSNNNHRAAQRKRLEWFLAKFACNPELVPDSDAGELLEHLETMYEQSKQGAP